MMNYEEHNTIGKRLHYFIQTCYENQLLYSTEIQCDKSTINRNVLDKSLPSSELLIAYYNSGLSIHWLFFCEGSMYSPTPNGERLKIFHSEFHLQNHVSTTHERVYNWILENYHDINNFAKECNIKIKLLKQTLDGVLPLTPNFFRKLHNSGLDIDWLIKYEGSSYARNSNGIRLKLEKEGILIDNREIDLVKEIHEMGLDSDTMAKVNLILNKKSSN